MAVAPVDGYGKITSSNAYEIYTAYKKGEVDLTTAQQKRCESFLSADEINEIDDVTYTSGTGEQAGKDALGEDVENAGNASGQGANAATMTAICAGVIGFGTGAIISDGFTQGAFAVTASALAAASIPMAYAYDSDYNERKQAHENADATDATIDDYMDMLIETLDEMNEDMDEYQAQSDALTTMLNENTSVMADLQLQLATAQSAGDTEGVKSLQEQMKQIQGADFSDQEEDLSDLVDKLDEYGELNSESIGVADGGQSISDFLKDGKALGIVAWVDVALLVSAQAIAVLATASLFPKIGPFFPDLAGTVCGKIMFAVCGVSLGVSAQQMKKKASEEVECGSAGDEMQEHVNALNEMVSEQLDYIDTTDETYMDIDEESEESQADAQEKADKAVESNSGSAGVSVGTTSDVDKEKEPIA